MTTRPNIVVVLADHVAFSGHYGREDYDYRWPNLEALGKQGVWFDKARAITPVCTPSRASFLTGKRPDKHGLRWNSEYPIPHNRTEFREDEIIFPKILEEAGYENFYYGKWHCGVEKTAEDYGLKGWSLPEYGNLYASERYKDYVKALGEQQPKCRIDHHLFRQELEGKTITLNPKEPWDFMDGAGVLLGSSELQEQFFVSNLACDALRERAEAKSDKPFSMVVSLWGPHHPYFPSEEFADKINPEDIPQYPSFDEDLSNKPWRYRIQRDLRCQHLPHKRWPTWSIWQKVLARCYAAGLQTDAAIGRIAACLKETGQLDNTLLIVTADHGDGIAAHGAGWDKYSSFSEEVASIPLVMHWPDGLPKGEQVFSPVSLLDVTETILDAAEADFPNHPLERDGKSLLPLAHREETRERLICEHYGHSGDVLFQKILYLDNWKYVACWGDDDELYDLSEDPYELTNRIKDASTFSHQEIMRDIIINDLESRRTERSDWKPAKFWEDGIVFSSPEWPREETLLLYMLRVQQGYKSLKTFD